MKKTFLFITIISLFAFSACNNEGGNKNHEGEGDSTEIASNDEVTKLSILSFEDEAEKYIDKKIKVEGTVSHICKHGGKKMHLFEAPIDSISVTIISDESFDADLEGSDIAVTGIVKEKRITKEEVEEMEEQYRIECDGSVVKDDVKKEGGVSKEQIDYLNELLEDSGKGYISFYSIEFLEMEEK